MADPVERLLFPPSARASESTPAGTTQPDLEIDSNERLHLQGNEDELVISAERKLTLRCGKSSITLHPNGKIVLRGEYILSDAEGTNRINGGRIELN